MNRRATSRGRIAGKGLLIALSFAIAAYAAVGYGVKPLGSLVIPDMKANFVAHPIGIYGHIGGAAIALLLGPFQFVTRLRNAAPTLHRWAGRVYLGVGVLGGGTFGLYMSQFAFGGNVARFGFAALSVCWLYSGARAYLAIRRRAIQKHRKWMVRNFALTFAAVTLRIYLPVSHVAGIEFTVAYPIIAWLAWVPNLLVAEWMFNTAKGSAPRRARAAASAHSSDS
jgi:uncharacterized membrane protein